MDADQSPQEDLNRGTVGCIAAGVDKPNDPLRPDDDIAPHLVGIGGDLRERSAACNSLEVKPEVARMPGAIDGSLQTVSLVDGSIEVQQKWKADPDSLPPGAGALGGLKTDQEYDGIQLFKTVLVLVQLHHMFLSVQSAEIAQEDQKNIVPLAEEAV